MTESPGFRLLKAKIRKSLRLDPAQTGKNLEVAALQLGFELDAFQRWFDFPEKFLEGRKQASLFHPN